MLLSMEFVFSLAGLCMSLWLYLIRSRKRSSSSSSRLRLPPGPPPLPIIGNLLDMPKSFEWLTFQRWSREYGSDIVHVNVAGTPILILNSLEVVTDLLEKRSKIYSSRVRLPMVNELMGWKFHFAFSPNDDTWRSHRRVFHQEFYPKAALRFRPEQLKSTHELLRRLLDTPEDWMLHLRHNAGSTIMSIAYGIDVLPKNDPYIEIAEKTIAALCHATIPGTFWVDQLPILMFVPSWFPGAGFKRKAKMWRRWADEMVERPYKVAKQTIAEGNARPSFTSYCLQNIDTTQDVLSQEEIVKNTAGAMYTAASDTTVSAVATFILAMATNPDAQAKAQAELDQVVGVGQLPSYGDEGSLPYVSAVVKEVLRWKPAAPTAIPHYLSAEDEYKGYRLPAGAIVIPNSWAILQDSNTYPDPFTFNPERFMKKDGTLDPDVQDPELAVFGYGRRVCPGRHMALATVWIAVASILAVFDISKARDEDGGVVEPSGEYTSGLISFPLPFKCNIRPRSRDAEALVRATANTTETDTTVEWS